MFPLWQKLVVGPDHYRVRLAAWVVSLSLVTLPVAQAESPIDSDDQVVFFPTAGALDADSREWVLPVHGWVFEPEEDSLKRSFLLGAFRRALGLDREQAETEFFRTRAGYFLVDNERGKRITLRIGEREFPLDPSGSNGHLHGTIRLPADDLGPEAAPQGLELTVVLPADDARVFIARVHLVSERGVSVISDIDDTIKITEVTKGKAVLLRRTFLQEFEAVPGMAQAYRKWQEQGAMFHYVSAGPWQLYPVLEPFLSGEQFPPGSFHMKVVRAKDPTLLDLFEAADKVKLAAIESLLTATPRRRFILVGDSGERDPEIYGEVARRFPEQVTAIFIRDVTDEDEDAPRYRDAFRGFPAEQWRIFTDPRELEAFTWEQP